MDQQFPPQLFPSFYNSGPPDSVLEHCAGNWGCYDRVRAEVSPRRGSHTRGATESIRGTDPGSGFNHVSEEMNRFQFIRSNVSKLISAQKINQWIYLVSILSNHVEINTLQYGPRSHSVWVRFVLYFVFLLLYVYRCVVVFQGGSGPVSNWTFTPGHQVRGETWRHTEPVPVPLLNPKRSESLTDGLTPLRIRSSEAALRLCSLILTVFYSVYFIWIHL